MSDRIFVDGLRVRCTIGVSSQEKKKPQWVIVDASMFLDLGKAGQSDSLADTVDYREVRKTITRVAAGREFHLLEALSQALASALLEEFRIDRVLVNVRKAKYSARPAIGVEIERKAGRHG